MRKCFNLLAKNWVDYLFNGLLITIVVVILVLLTKYFIGGLAFQATGQFSIDENSLAADTVKEVIDNAQKDQKNINGVKPTKKENPTNTAPPPPTAIPSFNPCCQSESALPKAASAQQINARTDSTGLKDLLPVFALIFALLGGVILKFSRDALEDIKKQSETAKLLDKHKSFEFEFLRLELYLEALVQHAVFATYPDSDYKWERVTTLDALSKFYEYANSLGDILFDHKKLRDKIDDQMIHDELVIDELRKDNKSSDFLKRLVELSQEKYPELANSVRRLYKKVKK